jgi:hypothetical protein
MTKCFTGVSGDAPAGGLFRGGFRAGGGARSPPPGAPQEAFDGGVSGRLAVAVEAEIGHLEQLDALGELGTEETLGVLESRQSLFPLRRAGRQGDKDFISGETITSVTSTPASLGSEHSNRISSESSSRIVCETRWVRRGSIRL